VFRNVDQLFNHLASPSEGLGKSSGCAHEKSAAPAVQAKYAAEISSRAWAWRCASVNRPKLVPCLSGGRNVHQRPPLGPKCPSCALTQAECMEATLCALLLPYPGRGQAPSTRKFFLPSSKNIIVHVFFCLWPTTPQRPPNDNGPHYFRCKRPQKRPKEQGRFVWR
jgi:hypothetical protein